MPVPSTETASWRHAPAPLVACATLVAAAAVWVPQFATAYNLLGLAQSAAAPLMVTLALAPCIALGDMDFSVEAVLALGGIVAAAVVATSGHVAIGVLAALAAGSMVGAVNAVLVVRLGLLSAATTLATMWVVRSLCLWIAGGRALAPPSEAGMLPATTGWLSIPAPVWATVGVIAALSLMRRRPKRSGDRSAAQRSMHLCVLGAVAALAGAMVVTGGRAAQPLGWQGASIDILAACLLGGAVPRRCAGPMLGLLAGAAIIIVERNVLDLLCAPAAAQYAVRGVTLLAALLWANHRRLGRLGGAASGEDAVT